MSSTDLIDELKAALLKSRDRLDGSRVHRDQMIWAAHHEVSLSMREIAAKIELSHQRVSQILARQTIDKGPPFNDLRGCQIALERAKADRDKCIRDANQAGVTVTEIARLVGLSRRRVGQIINNKSPARPLERPAGMAPGKEPSECSLSVPSPPRAASS